MIHLLLLMLGLYHYTYRGKKIDTHKHPHGGRKAKPGGAKASKAPTVWEAQATTKAPKSLGKPGSLREQAERANRAYSSKVKSLDLSNGIYGEETTRYSRKRLESSLGRLPTKDELLRSMKGEKIKR